MLPGSRRLLMAALAVLTLALAAPNRAFAASPLDDPRAHGMVEVASGIWREPASDARHGEDARLAQLVHQARQRVQFHYGALTGRANVVFCATDACFERFGAHGLGFSDGVHVLIAPRGQRVAIVAHELAHVELATRLGGMEAVMRRVPQWFDEGLAVFISGAAEFSEPRWHAATDGGRRAPTLTDIADMDGWNRLTGKQGMGMQLTYGTACHELRRWMGVVGHAGARRLLSALQNEESFASAYLRIEHEARAVPVYTAHQGRPWASASAGDGALPDQTIRDTAADRP